MVIVQVLDFSVCMFHSGPPEWSPITDNSSVIAMGTLMCLLVVIRFARESLQMYKVSNQFQASRYLSLLVRDGMFYYLAYVSIS